MKAKHYKKLKKYHSKAEKFCRDKALQSKNAGASLALWRLHEYHKDKAIENNVKWYDKAFEGSKWSADANQIRETFNAPNFDPKRESVGEEQTEFVGWGNLTPAKFVRMCPPGCRIHTEDQHGIKYAREGNVDGIN